MYATIHIANSVVNYFVLELALQSLVCAELIGKQSGSCFDVLSYSAVKGFLLAICKNLSANLAAALQDSHDHDLVIGVAALSGDATGLDALVHVTSLSANEGFVGFDFARELRSKSFILHGQANMVDLQLATSKSEANRLARAGVVYFRYPDSTSISEKWFRVDPGDEHLPPHGGIEIRVGHGGRARYAISPAELIDGKSSVEVSIRDIEATPEEYAALGVPYRR